MSVAPAHCRVNRHRWPVALTVMVAALLACSLPARLLPAPTAPPPPTATRAPRATHPPEPAAGGLGRIIFCDDVTEAGEPVNPSRSFPAGTCDLPSAERPPGTVLVSVTAYNERPWEELAVAPAHALTQAVQRLDNRPR